MNDAAPAPRWRRAALDDLDAVMAIQDEVHSLLPERREVFVDKMRRCPEGCMVLGVAGRVLGYGVAHPWRLDDVPPLDTVLSSSGPFDCLFLHDVALLPDARGRGAGAAFARHMAALAQASALPALALVSVYGTVPIWETCGFTVRSGTLPPGKLLAYGDTARYMTAILP